MDDQFTLTIVFLIILSLLYFSILAYYLVIPSRGTNSPPTLEENPSFDRMLNLH